MHRGDMTPPTGAQRKCTVSLSTLFHLLDRSPVVELHLCRLPLLKLTRDVGGSAEEVLHVEEELLFEEEDKDQTRHSSGSGLDSGLDGSGPDAPSVSGDMGFIPLFIQEPLLVL